MFLKILFNLILTLSFWRADFPATFDPGVRIITLKPDAAPVTVAAEKGAVLAAQDHFFLYTKNADATQPIASITKLMTALVFLENNPGWDTTYTITADDKVEGGRLNLFLGEEIKIKDLFYTSLVASDNGATIALVHASGLSPVDFVKKMNEQAKILRLTKTRFVDPIGLSEKNVSSAREVALLGQAALNQEEIRQVTAKKDYRFQTLAGKEKLIESTDYLLFDSAPNHFQVLGGKTGYTDQAGYCFVGRFQDKGGRELISVVLNSRGKNERFKESKQLVNWVLENYLWPK